ncbi:pancreatic triacylglycerol lipase-like, partial [Adelges cooleyi]|uniref:pancreatic triacylglycerol lipase-like n=1 Tax=Adelges cooleyi TaxID=133065 RepID=UPI002180472F
NNSDSNVILVQWRSRTFYFTATLRIRKVGQEIANLINYLGGLVGLDQENVHLIGHSLGAHTAGYAGKHLKGLGRITGLDPAEPKFKGAHSKHRLDHTDAQLVNVIHTGAPSTYFGFGIKMPCGHVDFYPNGGTKQPGCNPFKIDLDEQNSEARCDHMRVLDLYTESINSKCLFVANKCDSYGQFLKGNCFSSNETEISIMGLKTTKPSYHPGTKYFLITGDASPYCIREYAK